MRLRLVLLLAGVGAVAAGCASGDSTPKGNGSTTSTTAEVTSTAAPPPVEGTTAWVDVTPTWKALAPNAFAKSPEQVAEDLAALRRGQDTSEVGDIRVAAVHRGEPLVIELAESGGPDDAVLETRTEITLEPGDEGWVVSRARQQQRCRQAPATPDATACS